MNFSSGAFRWPTAKVNFTRGTIDHYSKGTGNYKEDIDDFLQWFTTGNKPINFGLFHVSLPDNTEHENNIYSAAVREKLQMVDDLVTFIC